MNGCRDLEGVHGTMNTFNLTWIGPGCQIGQTFHFSRMMMCWTAMEDEVAVRVHGVFPMPMGMEREDRCE